MARTRVLDYRVPLIRGLNYRVPSIREPTLFDLTEELLAGQEAQNREFYSIYDALTGREGRRLMHASASLS